MPSLYERILFIKKEGIKNAGNELSRAFQSSRRSQQT